MREFAGHPRGISQIERLDGQDARALKLRRRHRRHPLPDHAARNRFDDGERPCTLCKQFVYHAFDRVLVDAHDQFRKTSSDFGVYRVDESVSRCDVARFRSDPNADGKWIGEHAYRWVFAVGNQVANGVIDMGFTNSAYL